MKGVYENFYVSGWLGADDTWGVSLGAFSVSFSYDVTGENDSLLNVTVPTFFFDGVYLFYEDEKHLTIEKKFYGVIFKDENYEIRVSYSTEDTGDVSDFFIVQGSVTF